MTNRQRIVPCIAILSLAAFLSGCGQKPATERNQSHAGIPFDRSKTSVVDPLRIVLLPVEGQSPLDLKIASAQKQVRASGNGNAALEKLGWLFVSKARTTFDSGFYKLAENCAVCLESRHPGSAEAILLRAHVLQNLHRFKEAEPLARALTVRRGMAFDFAVLGDVLMEQGRLDEAIISYQQMADLKPDPQAYTRTAHVRWLKGDLEGAIEMMQMAAQAASPRDPETAAWVHTRLALYSLQAGNAATAEQHCRAALDFQADYPPALLARGRILLSQSKLGEAVESLRRAAALNPLPEYLWALSEALKAADRLPEAAEVEAKLKAGGPAADPRTFSLYLATRGQDTAKAVRLAKAELNTRADVFTWDALAWSLAAEGRWAESAEKMGRALAEGTQDARLFLHAGVIDAKTGSSDLAQRRIRQSNAIAQMLLPSERAQLKKYLDASPSVAINSPTPLLKQGNTGNN